MNKNVILIICFLLSACKYTRVYFSTYLYYNDRELKRVYSIRIPKNYYLKTIKAGGGEVGKEQQYFLPDSAIVSISNGDIYIANYSNIENAGFTDSELELRVNDSLVNKIVFLEGKDERGLNWKEVWIGSIRIGYLNVCDSQKKKYDRIFKTIRYR